MSKSKITLNWTKADKLPQTPHRKVSQLGDFSDTLLIVSHGNIIPGNYMKYKQDFNAHHLQAKAGQGVYMDMHGNPLNNVTQYYPTRDIEVNGTDSKPD